MDKARVFPRGTDAARVVVAIETAAARGCGTDEQPVRRVMQYWTLDGEFLAENDPCAEVIVERVT